MVVIPAKMKQTMDEIQGDLVHGWMTAVLCSRAAGRFGTDNNFRLELFCSGSTQGKRQHVCWLVVLEEAAVQLVNGVIRDQNNADAGLRHFLGMKHRLGQLFEPNIIDLQGALLVNDVHSVRRSL